MTAPGLHPYGTPAAELKLAEQAHADQQPAVSLCTRCPDYRYEGTAAECRAESAQHRQQYHPDTTRLKPRRRGSLQKFVEHDHGQRAEGLANAAETARMLARRSASEAA